MDSTLQLQKRIEILEERLSVNAEGGYRSTQFEYETTVPLVEDLRVIGTQNDGSWAGALTWIEPQNIDIAGYEIWVKNVNGESSGWVKKGEVTQPPWSDNIITSSSLTVQFAVRTKFRNGLGTTIDNSPTVPVSILAPSVSITDPSQVGPNVIGDSAFLRTGLDAISIVNADIVSLQATKITAGTLVAGVIYANAIAASQITAGTISAAVTMTSPTIIASDGTTSIQLSAGTLFAASDLDSDIVEIASDSVVVQSTGGTSVIAQGLISLYHNSGSGTAKVLIQGTSSGGILLLQDGGGSTDITLDATAGGNITAAGTITGDDINATGDYSVDGTTVINSSGAFVGAGVDVGSNGVGCGGVNISGGYTGQTVTFSAFPTQMDIRGGVLTGYTP